MEVERISRYITKCAICTIAHIKMGEVYINFTLDCNYCLVFTYGRIEFTSFPNNKVTRAHACAKDFKRVRAN